MTTMMQKLEDQGNVPVGYAIAYKMAMEAKSSICSYAWLQMKAESRGQIVQECWLPTYDLFTAPMRALLIDKGEGQHNRWIVTYQNCQEGGGYDGHYISDFCVSLAQFGQLIHKHYDRYAEQVRKTRTPDDVKELYVAAGIAAAA